MRMYFQTERVARRFVERSEAVSGLLCWHQQYRNGWRVNVTNILNINLPHCYQCDRQESYLFPDGQGGRCTRVEPE